MATQNMWQSTNPATVGSGGTGDSSFTTTNSVLCSGTTTTGPIQAIGSTGSSGQVLISNGSGALPSWGPVASLGGDIVLLQTQTVGSVSSVDFTSQISGTYNNYFLIMTDVQQSIAASGSNHSYLAILVSSDNGATWITSAYEFGYADFGSGSGSNFLGAVTPISRTEGFSSGNVNAPVTGNSSGISTSQLVNAYIYFYNLSSLKPTYNGRYLSTNYTSVVQASSSPSKCGPMGGRFDTLSNPINAIQFRSWEDTANVYHNILGGTFSLYGIVS